MALGPDWSLVIACTLARWGATKARRANRAVMHATCCRWQQQALGQPRDEMMNIFTFLPQPEPCALLASYNIVSSSSRLVGLVRHKKIKQTVGALHETASHERDSQLEINQPNNGGRPAKLEQQATQSKQKKDKSDSTAQHSPQSNLTLDNSIHSREAAR